MRKPSSRATTRNKKKVRVRGYIAILAPIISAPLIALGFMAWKMHAPSPVTPPVATVKSVTNQSTQSSSSSSSSTTSSCPEAGACDADAQKYCTKQWSGTSIEASWKLDLVHCLYDDNKDNIGALCLQSLECRQSLNDALLLACRDDQRNYCRGVTPTPGSEPLVDCLETNFTKLSSACAAAWTAHDAAKPE